MKLLEENIKAKGQVLSGDILKVDNFLNHQIDPELLMAMGQDFAEHFKHAGITKILTLEVSGIAVAFAAAYHLGVPLVFAKKTDSVTLSDNNYSSQVYSYTKKKTYTIRVDKKFMTEQDTILLIDDFLAAGQALGGMLELCEQAKSKVAGIGIAIEKVFQGGGNKYRALGYDVYSQAMIHAFEEGQVVFE